MTESEAMARFTHSKFKRAGISNAVRFEPRQASDGPRGSGGAVLVRNESTAATVLAEIDAGRVRLQICNGADATAWFPEMMMALAATPGHQLLLDGEVCV